MISNDANAASAAAANLAKGTKRTSIEESVDVLPKSKRLANEPDDTVTPKPPKPDRNNNNKNNDTIVLDDSSSTDSTEIVYIQTKVCTRARARNARLARNTAQAQQVDDDSSQPTTSSKATLKQTPTGVPTVVELEPPPATQVPPVPPVGHVPSETQATPATSQAPVAPAQTAAAPRATATAHQAPEPVRPPRPARPSIPVTDRLLATVADVFPNISVDRIRSLVQQMPIENSVDPLRLPEELQINMVMNHLLLLNPDLDNREEEITALNSVIDNQSNSGDDEAFAYLEETSEEEEEEEADADPNLPQDEVDEMIENAMKDYIASANARATETANVPAATVSSSSAAAAAAPLPNLLGSAKFKRNLKNDLREVMAVLVDCDPIYLIGQAMIFQNSPNRVETVISAILEKKSYPKLKDFKEKERHKKDLENHLNMELNMDEFLKLYPDPVAHFYNIETEMSSNYKRHCQAYLCNKFVYFTSDTIEDVLRKHKYHLTPAVQQINGAFDERVIVSRIAQHLKTHGHRARNIPKRKNRLLVWPFKLFAFSFAASSSSNDQKLLPQQDREPASQSK